MLAEFIVAAALGIATGGVREGWAVWDLTSPDGVRIEVKSSGYLQSWGQKELSRISFNVRETLAWDADLVCLGFLVARIYRSARYCD